MYARLPELGEGEIVASVLLAGASVLELGCGTGRITRRLVRLGCRVTAVDESAEMLAHVLDAGTVQARIEGLELGRPLDAALLASNLVTEEPARRRALLEAFAARWSTRSGETWRHPFETRVFADQAELEAALPDEGLRFEQWLDARWFTARADRAPPGRAPGLSRAASCSRGR